MRTTLSSWPGGRGDYGEATRLTMAGMALVIGRILELTLNKTEAMWFHVPRRRPLRDSHIRVDDVRIEVRSFMKYLGLVLDSRWNFRVHFDRLALRLMGQLPRFPT